MKKSMKKILALISSAAMMATMITVPITAKADTDLLVEGDTLIKEWKLDFGASTDSLKDGYTRVTPDMHPITSTFGEGEAKLGFLGTNDNDYKLSDRYDGMRPVKGHVTNLVAQNGAIGSLGAKNEAATNGFDYPVRFAMYCDFPELKDGQDPMNIKRAYYRVQATITTLDDSKSADATLYAERKHALLTHETINAGESVTVDFSVDVEPIYYEKSEPKGLFYDNMLNVVLAGENAAIDSMIIQQVQPGKTLWVLGDSTVTDGGAQLPYFELRNYTGVGSGLSKYLRSDIAVSNQGEGGLNATDSNHFNVVAGNIKKGDYMYVEYGHNHKNDGVPGYEACLKKYYDACKKVGATLILVGPIDRIQDSQYNSATNAWSSTLSGFSAAAKAYADANKSSGDIAYIDLNAPSLKWFGEVTKDKGINAIKYYFQTGKGGSTDRTHPNDAGAQALAKLFFEDAAAKIAEYPALSYILSEQKNKDWTPISTDITGSSSVGGDAWPETVSAYKMAAVNDDVKFDEDGKLESVDIKIQDKNLMSSYGRGIFAVYENGKLVDIALSSSLDNGKDHVDNTNSGTVTLEFANSDITVKDGQDYKLFLWGYQDNPEAGNPISMVPYTDGTYTPSDYVYLLPGDNGNVETFDYYGTSDLLDSGKWEYKGSNVKVVTLGTEGTGDNARTYTNVIAQGGNKANSFWLIRPLENLSGGTGTSGRYVLEFDVNWSDLSYDAIFELAEQWIRNSPYVAGSQFEMLRIAKDGVVKLGDTTVGTISKDTWTTIHYELDMDMGVAEAYVGNDEANKVTVDIPLYKTFEKPDINSLSYFVITTPRYGKFELKMSNLTLAKYKTQQAVKKNIKVSSSDVTKGTAYIDELNTLSKDVTQSSTVTVHAVTADSSKIFIGWKEKDGDGTILSTQKDWDVRVYRDVEFVAEFGDQHDINDVVSFTPTASATMVKRPTTGTREITLGYKDPVDNTGNIVIHSDDDFSYALTNPAAGLEIDGNKLIVKPEYEMEANALSEITVNVIAKNGVTESVDITIYSYAFYEEVGDGVNYTGICATLNGKESIIFPDKNATGAYTFGETVTLDKKTTITMDMGLGPKDVQAAKTLNFKDSKGNTIFSMNYVWRALNVDGSSDAAIDLAIEKSKIRTMTIEIDPDANTVTVNVADAGDNKTATTTLAAGAEDLAGIDFYTPNHSGGTGSDYYLGMSKIKIEQ